MSTQAPAWAYESFFYHIYPLGMCGAPLHNFHTSAITPRLNRLYAWLPHLKRMGVNGLYLGPLWESMSHGYDTVDYHQLDRRLGHNRDLHALVKTCHQLGVRVVVDGVLNHVGRHFFAFESLKKEGKNSPYTSWFRYLRWGKRSKRGDNFTYEGWKSHSDLVKLNLKNPEVKKFIFGVVHYWIITFDIDGIRLDAADCMDKDFLNALRIFCKQLKPDFWLMGEVVMGDYRAWNLDSITNYELYDSFHKSHNHYDYRPLARTLERQWGQPGVYRSQGLFNFVDNHDVNRIASQLKKPAHLYPLHLLLFTLPGVPCVYYGSEVGLEGKRFKGSDQALRPFLTHPDILKHAPHPHLFKHICHWAWLRKRYHVLVYGSYRTVHAEKHLLCFERRTAGEHALVIVNLSSRTRHWTPPASVDGLMGTWLDVLNHEKVIIKPNCPLTIYSNWGRILCR